MSSISLSEKRCLFELILIAVIVFSSKYPAAPVSSSILRALSYSKLLDSKLKFGSLSFSLFSIAVTIFDCYAHWNEVWIEVTGTAS